LKVLIIIDTMGLGGAQEVIKGLIKNGLTNSELFCYALRTSENQFQAKNNAFIFPSKNKYSLKPLFDLRRKIKAEDICILHCHLFRSQVFGWLTKKLFFPGIKLIFHEHGKIYGNKLFYNVFLRLTKNQVDVYIAVSDTTKKHLINNAKIPQDKIEVVYNYVDLDKYNRRNIVWNIKKERKKLSIANDDIVIGFAGRLIENKGWRVFVSAAAKALENHSNLVFLIAGDGRDKGKLQRFIQNQENSDKIKYLGYVPNMNWFYSLLDILIISSASEASPMVYYEAQACGLPIIASNIPAITEFITNGENGLLFKVNDENELLKKINLLISDKLLREKMVRNGLELINIFSLDNYKVTIDELYYKISVLE
jgi:L-malate glycosyltransferase